MIVDKTDEAVSALNKAGFTTRLTDVAVLEIDDVPGSLAKIMELFEKTGANIEYLYASLKSNSGKAVIIFRLEDHNKLMQIIEENNLTLVEKF